MSSVAYFMTVALPSPQPTVYNLHLSPENLSPTLLLTLLLLLGVWE